MSPKIKLALKRLLARWGYGIARGEWILPDAKAKVAATAGADLVFDIGANTGQFAASCRQAGYRGAIASFEPQTGAFDKLTQNAAADDHWSTHRLALSDHAGSASMHVSGNSASSSLLPLSAEHCNLFAGTDEVGSEEVRVATLDEYTAEAGLAFESAVLKLDVQGLELSVLRGAVESIARVSTVISEVNFAGLFDGQSKWLEVCSWLESHGFELKFLCDIESDPSGQRMLFADVVYTRRPQEG